MPAMNRREFVKRAGAAAAATALPTRLHSGERPPGGTPRRPNIVYFLIDDLGWSDVSYHGGPYKTPNIDALALGGTRLEQFYAQPLCSPTRAALLTGRYPIRHGLQTGVVRPWAQYGLPLEERTLAQALKEAGYFTAICGKWHLGHFDPAYLPTRRGFDHQYGHYNGALDYFTHLRDGGLDWHRNDKACRDEGYTTHLIARETVRLIEERNSRQPFFLYVAFNAIHGPDQAPESYVSQYANLPKKQSVVGGMTAALDEAIGQIVEALDKKSLRKDTLILFASDNGGPRQGSNGPFRGYKNTLYEGGVRVAAFANWEGVLKPGAVVNQPLHIVDWYPTLLRLAGGSLEQKMPLDGKDIWPTLTEGRPSPHEEIFLNSEERVGAIRVGDWKLVITGKSLAAAGGEGAKKAKAKKRSADQPVGPATELFNLAQDPYEKENLAEKMPEKVRELRARYEALAKQAAPAKGMGTQDMPTDWKAPAVYGEKELLKDVAWASCP